MKGVDSYETELTPKIQDEICDLVETACPAG